MYCRAVCHRRPSDLIWLSRDHRTCVYQPASAATAKITSTIRGEAPRGAAARASGRAAMRAQEAGYFTFIDLALSIPSTMRARLQTFIAGLNVDNGHSQKTLMKDHAPVFGGKW